MHSLWPARAIRRLHRLCQKRRLRTSSNSQRASGGEPQEKQACSLCQTEWGK